MFGFPRHNTNTDAAQRPQAMLRLEKLEERDVPATIAVADTYSTGLGRVLTVDVTTGLLANDFSTTLPGAVLTAQLVAGPTYQNSLTPLPAGSLRVNPNGSFTFIAPTNVPFNSGPVIFTYQATNPSNGEVGFAQVTINLLGQNVKLIATGADAGGGPHVRVYEAGTSILKFNFFPYEPTFTGGVRVAVGDVNGDGVDDIITIPEAGGAARLRVYDGIDGATIVDTILFGVDFRGGGYVAVGDFNGDGRKDIIVGAGEGGAARVVVLTLTPTLNTIADFFAYDDNVRAGVRVAAGDLNRVGRDFLITAPGAGGGPQINVYDGQKVIRRPIATPNYSFFAADSSNRDGVFVSTGNLRGDGKFDIITGNGAGPGIVRVFDGRTAGLIREIAIPVDATPTGSGTPSGPSTFNFQTPANGALLSPSQAPTALVNAVTGTGSFGIVQGGVRVAAVDWNNDGLDDIITASGPGNSPRVRVINTRDQTEITSIVPYSTTFLGGVNVAAS